MIGHKFIATVWLILLCSCAGGNGPPPQTVGDASALAEKSPTLPATLPSVRPSPGAGEQWIEVVLDRQTVILHDGDSIAGEFTAAAGVGTSPETTTYPGEFRVQTMMPGPVESVPGVYVTDVVIFDWQHGNGFHSRPVDKDGNILDATLGKPATAGCIRLAESGELYRFARLGMRVVIH
jgi:lipoprotein-anchoring transpeptidase ErfK/SrfK